MEGLEEKSKENLLALLIRVGSTKHVLHSL